MASGCPVVCSDIEVFREVYGGAAVYFDSKSATDLAKKLNILLDNQNLKKELVEKGLRQASKYSWKKLALETLNLYKEVISKEKNENWN